MAKKMLTLSILSMLLNLFLGAYCFADSEKSFVVVTASYNNKDWYERNLNSIFSQNYKNYRLIYVDDCSTDGTGELVERYVKSKNIEHKVTLIRNTDRRGALANQYRAIHSCKDHEIIVILDGDDWLAHDDVLSYLNTIYADGTIWLTYGQFQEYPRGTKGFCCPMPAHIVARNAFREFAHIPSHLRTYYAGLFKRIKREDLLYKGDFFKMSCDIAAMFPMIEMARDHFKFIPGVLCIYNGANPINAHKISKKLQRELDLVIRSRHRYDKIDSPIGDADLHE